MIEFRTVSIGYGTNHVLQNISAQFSENISHAILGASGCGKTTLLKALLTFLCPNHYPFSNDTPWIQGTVLVEDRLTVGYVPQEPSLAPWLTVRDNLLLGLKLNGVLQHVMASVEFSGWLSRVLNHLRLTNYKQHYPRQLSVGTSKRASLARALLLRPTLLILDEPFAGFDFDVRESAIQLIRDYVADGQITLLMVTHEPYEVASICD